LTNLSNDRIWIEGQGADFFANLPDNYEKPPADDTGGLGISNVEGTAV